MIGGSVLVALVLGCTPEVPPECGPFEERFVYADGDGDGYGSTAIGWVCGVDAGQSVNAADCDDEDATVHPTAPELCDLLDNDCNGRADETLAKVPWFPDEDGDGYGLDSDVVIACAAPGEAFLQRGGDCDDGDRDVSPGAIEVCNGLDDDCDQQADDADPGVDPTTRTYWYQDADGDGFGNPDRNRLSCAGPPGAVANGDDCNDERPRINPAEAEACNDIDDDCDGLVDDDDPTIDPASQTEFFADTDEDGFGDPAARTLACEVGNGSSLNGQDCDDSDPIVTIPTDWTRDADGDGYGAGASFGFDCFPQGIGTVPARLGEDCDDADPDRSPGIREICEDGVDNDCSGIDDRCGPIGHFNVEDGDSWVTNPPVMSCVEACAFLFGGVADDYACSTREDELDNHALVSGWADGSFCSPPGVDETFSQAGPGGGYDCGVPFCSYSAYVQDNCFNSRNWCWLR